MNKESGKQTANRQSRQPFQVNGSNTVTPAFSKSTVFRVTMVNPLANAVEAIRLSFTGIALRVRFNSANRCDHSAATVRSKSSTRRDSAPVANHDSKRFRRLPSGRIKIPYSNSPRTIELTANSASLTISQSTTARFGVGFVGSLNTFASTKYFTTYRWIQTATARTNPSQGNSATS